MKKAGICGQMPACVNAESRPVIWPADYLAAGAGAGAASAATGGLTSSYGLATTGAAPQAVPQVVTAQAGAVLQQALVRVLQQLLAVWHGAAVWQQGAAATWQPVLQPVLQVEVCAQQFFLVFAQHLRAWASVAVRVMAAATTHKQIKFFISTSPVRK